MAVTSDHDFCVDVIHDFCVFMLHSWGIGVWR
jgi:hypothetical protein